MIAINTYKHPFRLRVIVTLIMLVVFSIQHPTSMLQAQGGTSICDTAVSFQYYDVAPDGSWVASGEWGQANTCIDPGAICPPGTGLIRVRPSSGAEFWHCGGGGLPDPPPNYPGINAGQACLAGSNRTVTITPTGDSHELQISPGNQIIALAGNSHTFTNLQQDVDYRFRAQAENSGGSSGWSSWTGIVRHDLTAPTTNLDLVGTSGSNNWWQSAVSVTLPATDSGCLGVSDTFYTLDSVASTYSGTAFEVSGDGTHDLSYYSTDGSYDEVSQSTAISIDTVVPTLSLTTDRASDSSNGWWTAPVTITVVGDDVTSGVDTLDTNHNSAGWTAYSAPITLSTDGTHNLDARVIDVAGWETVDGIVIPIDTSAPTLYFTFDREPDRNGWYNDSVSVGVESADATSGVSDTVARLVYEGTWRNYTGAYLIGGDGEHLFEAVVTDIAGNVTARQVTVPIDVTPPTTTLIWDGETLDMSATDNRSGVMGTTLTINGIVTPYTGEAIEFEIVGDYRIEVYSTDMAGNDEAVQVLNLTYDPNASSVTTSTSLSTPTLEADLTCSDDRYDITGFASATSGLSAVYLLAQSDRGDAFEVTGSRYSYNPASTTVEAFTFNYSPDDGLDYSVTVVAEDISGGERRLDLDCPSGDLLLVPIPNEDTSNLEPSTDYLNQYPASLGDMSSDVETPVQPSVETEDSFVAQANANTPITSNYVAPDTRVTVIEPTSPELTIVEGRSSGLSAEDLAQILSLTGLLATTTAAVGLQVTETARRREEELEAERLEAEQQRQADLDAQAQRARENADMNAQMREDAQREVILEVQQSEANKQYHEYVAALWAEYYARLDAAQQYQMEHFVANHLQQMIEYGDYQRMQKLNAFIQSTINTLFEQYNLTSEQQNQLLLLSSEINAGGGMFAQLQILGNVVAQASGILTAEAINEATLLSTEFDVHLTSSRDGDATDWTAWSNEGIRNVFLSVMDTSGAFGRLYDTGQLASYVEVTTSAELFKSVMGRTHVNLSDDLWYQPTDPNESPIPITWSAQTGIGFDDDGRFNKITVFTDKLTLDDNKRPILNDDGSGFQVVRRDQFNQEWFRFNMVHEFGHVVNQRIKNSAVDILARGLPGGISGYTGEYNAEGIAIWQRSQYGWGTPRTDMDESYLTMYGQQNDSPTPNEEWADMFMYWVYDAFHTSEIGQFRQEWVDNNMSAIINTAFRRSLGANQLVAIVLGWDTQTNPLPFTSVSTAGDLNLNYYPATSADPQGSFTVGTEMHIVGRNEDGTHIGVITDTEIAWISAEVIRLENPEVNINTLRDIDQSDMNALQGDMNANG